MDGSDRLSGELRPAAVKKLLNEAAVSDPSVFTESKSAASSCDSRVNRTVGC